MADNFNLRSFLSENKLTKNAKLIKEGSDYGYESTMNAVDDMFEPGTPENDQLTAAVEDAFHKGDIDYSEYSHSPSAPSQQVAAIAREIGLLEAKQEDSMEEAVNLDNNPFTPHNFDGVAREVKKHKHIMAIANKLFPQYGGELENFKPLSREERDQVMSQYTDETRVAPVKESKLTAKEQALVEMVQAALSEEDVDYTMGRQDDPNQLPNPAPELNIPEGDEMVKENPLPKYKHIDELMSNIEQGTNEAAHKYKMNRMKEVAEALEAKVGSLEEGENAEHIDQKVVKQMRKDIQALRKAEEKLRKEFEKKFASKKEEKEDK